MIDNHDDSHEHPKEVTIVVNGRAKKWDKEQISYADVVRLAALPVPSGRNPGFTVIYHNGPDHTDGTLIAGHSVGVREGMIFNVTPTSQS